MEVAYKTNVHGYTFAIQHALHAMKQNLVTPGLKGSKGALLQHTQLAAIHDHNTDAVVSGTTLWQACCTQHEKEWSWAMMCT